MYQYSPISKLYIKNFRNIGEVAIDFTESPIITLVGENEAGKTSVIKAFATCALHASPREQKDYIRDDTKMFGVAIDLEDGTRVVRMKEASGVNSYQVIGSDKKVVFNTNKIAEGLPEEVQKVMGLIVEPETGEFLHIRTYEDKLLFVVTPNSTNYKVMYNALKVEQLTKAIKIGSNESNALKNQISSDELRINTLGSQLKAISLIDVEPLVNVRDRLIEQTKSLNKLIRAIELRNKMNECERSLGALALIQRFSLDEINEVNAHRLSSINNLIYRKNNVNNLLSNISKINDIEEINTNVLDKISNIKTKIDILTSKKSNAGAMVHLSEISEISESEVVQLNKAVTLLLRLNTVNRQLKLINIESCNEIEQCQIDIIDKANKIIQLSINKNQYMNDLEPINTYISQVQDYMIQCGVAVESCPKCGESVIFDMDKLK